MSNIELVYCFTFNLTEDYIFKSYKDRIIEIIKTSIQYNKKFHDIILYTDFYTYNIMGYSGAETRFVDTSNFRMSDDFKLHLHPMLSENQILIDFDIFLKKPLIVNKGSDIILEQYEDSKFFYRYDRTINQLLNYKIYDKFKNIKVDKELMANIGILKINNPDLWNQYTKMYYTFRNHFIIEVGQNESLIKYSAMFGQYTLSSILLNSNYDIYISNKNKDNKYIHLNTYGKYMSPLTELLKPIRQNSIL